MASLLLARSASRLSGLACRASAGVDALIIGGSYDRQPALLDGPWPRPLFGAPLRRCFSSSSPAAAQSESSDATEAVPAASEPGLLIGDKFVPTSQVEGVQEVISTIQNQQDPASSPWYWLNPIHGCEFCLDYLHDLGLPWWGTIVLATIVTRTTMLPLSIKAMRAAGWIAEITKEFSPKLQSTKDPYAQTQIRNEMYQAMRSRGLNPWSSFTPMFLQFPILVTYFLTLRSMAENVPSLQEGGLLWFVNLAESDPYFRLPIISSLIMYFNMEYSWSKAMAISGNPIHWGVKLFGRIFSTFALFVTAAFPQAIHLYWCTSNTISLLQTIVTSIPSVRTRLGLVQAKQMRKVEVVDKVFEVKGGKAKVSK